jgi:hypothetical protein
MRHLAFPVLFLVELVAAIQTSLSDDHLNTPVAVPEGTRIKIPMQLVMTAKSGGIDELPTKQRNNVRETLALNPGVTLRWLTDDMCRDYIAQHYDSTLLSAFNSENHGSYRGDICRAAVIAIEGGFYADLDVQFRVPFVDTVDENTTFVSSFDIYCNVLNAFFAVEPHSAVMLSVVAAIKDWYANPNTTRPNNAYLGTWTMLGGLKDVVSSFCPEVDLNNISQLQTACGSHHQLRFYREQRIQCFGVGTSHATECPDGRKKSHFQGTQFGLFELGPERNLVAWSRFENCSKWGCEERLEQNATPGACKPLVQYVPHPVRPVTHPVQHSVPHPPVPSGPRPR